jgi:trimeric autotransporter adhesin
MPIISNAFVNALLADASYVDELAGKTGQPLSDLLKARMTQELADFISSNFKVITQIDSSDYIGSGFDATVWRGVSAEFLGQTYVSMRGSQGPADFIVDIDLSLPGSVADAQIIDMVNWWRGITTPAGQAIDTLVRVPSPPNTYVLLWVPLLSTGTGELAGVTNVIVNGHSLGGHLASTFARLFGNSVAIDAVSTFNSAGFAVDASEALQSFEAKLGYNVSVGRFLDEVQTNYFAVNGLNLTTNTIVNQIGRRTELFNENSTTLIPNHFMYKLSDALALGTGLANLIFSATHRHRIHPERFIEGNREPLCC